MGAIAEAFVEIRGDLSKFEGDVKDAMNDAETVVRKNADDVFAPLDKSAATATGNMGGHFGKLASIAGTALATVGIGQFVASSVTAASDLGESVNAINVVLGDGAKSFLDFGTTSAQALGIPQAALNESVVPLAALLKGAGMQGDELSKSLQDLATRASDTGSVLNKDVNEVLGAFGAAVRGEAEPARALGVSFNDATVQAKAMELGLASSTGEITDAAKQQARLAIIMEQTNQFAGDFGNTLGSSLPNQMKVFSSLIEQTKGALGTALIPALTGVLQAVTPLLPALTPLLTLLGKTLGGVISKLVPIIVKLVQVMGPPLEKIFAKLGPVIGDLLDALGPLIVELVDALMPIMPPLVDAFVLFLKAIIPLIPIITKLINFISPLIPVLAPLILLLAGPAGLIPAVVALTAAVGFLLPFLRDIAGVVGGALKTALDVVVGLFTKLPGLIIDALSALPGLVRDLVVGFFTIQYDLFKLGIETIVGFVTELPGKIVDALASIGQVVGDVFNSLWDGIKEIVSTAIAAVVFYYTELPLKIVGALADLLPKVVGVFLDMITAVKDKVVGFIADVVQFHLELPGRIVGALIGMGSKVWTVFTDAATQALGAISKFIADVINFFLGLPGQIVAGLVGIANKFIDIGKKVIGWIVDGIKAAPGVIKDAIMALVPSPGDIIGSIGSTIKGGVGKLIPGADGGIFTGPTPRLIGEAGAEALIPMTRPSRAMDLLESSGLADLVRSNTPVTAVSSGFSGPITLIIEGQPFTAMLAAHDSAQALQLRAGTRR